MPAEAGYRTLFAITGLPYVVIAFIARLPLAMSQLGTLLLVAGTTGSYGEGGACAGALAIANAAGSPIGGALADRFGQRPVVFVQSACGAIGLASIVLVTHGGAEWPAIAAVAAATGLVLPQIGPLARVRWSPLIVRAGANNRLVGTAFSYEGAADEASFVLGPALVGILGTIGRPSLALITAAILLGVFGVAYAVHPTHVATPRQSALPVGRGRLVTPALLVLMTAQFVIGTVFGSVQQGTTVLATAAGHASVAGLFHALLGAGSVVAGIGMAALPDRIPLLRRWRTASAALLVLSAPLLVVHSLAALAPTLLVLGCCIAPYMITTFTLGERVTPAPRLGAAMTLLAATTGLGYATGAAVAGRLADWNGETPAFAVSVSAGLLAVLLAAAAGRRLSGTH